MSANDVTVCNVTKPTRGSLLLPLLFCRSISTPPLPYNSPPLGSPCFLSLWRSAASLQLCLWIHTACVLLHLAALCHQMSGSIGSVVSCIISFSFSLWSRVALYKHKYVYPFYPLLTVFCSVSSLWQL